MAFINPDHPTAPALLVPFVSVRKWFARLAGLPFLGLLSRTTVLAVLAGAAGPTVIARWAELKEGLLTRILDLSHGIPGQDVFRRVLMLLQPEAFEAAFNAWIARLRDDATAETGVDRPIISLDGKSARRSHDASHELGALHVVTAWAGEYGLALGLQVCEEKSNEITASPELLR